MATNSNTTKSSTTQINGKTYTKGQSFTDSAGRTGTVKYDTKTGKSLSDPVNSSTSVRNDNNATGVDIRNLKNAYAEDNAMLREQQRLLAERRTNTLNDINTEFDINAKAQENSQKSDYAARSTSLVTSGGGFLGATQSQSGVLQNLQNTFDSEKTALIAKRDAAINAANTAYEDKDFALAKELSQNAKDLQNEIYKRQTDYADMQLKLASENRNQTEFDLGITDKKVASYANMSDADYAKIDTSETDKLYYPGYTNNAREVAKKANNIKTQQDQVNLEKDILTMRLSMPAGKRFTLGGQTYTGLKEASGMTADERKNATFQTFDTLLSGQKNTQGTPLYTIPGTSGIPYIDENGYITKKGWDYLSLNSGLAPNDFIERYSALFNKESLDNYKLSDVQKNLIRNKI